MTAWHASQAWAPDELKSTALPIDLILPTKDPSQVRIEADMPLEYLPFSAAELSFPGKLDDPLTCT